jgi:GNAT superfamily N-acetyltransferase
MVGQGDRAGQGDRVAKTSHFTAETTLRDPKPAMTSCLIRPAIQADTATVRRLIRALAEYEHELHNVTATEADLHDALFGPVPRIYAVLAEVDREPVGLALFYYTFNTFKARPDIFLEDLFVEPAHRGTGIGFALMRHLAQRAVAENCTRVEWRVLNWNQPSIDFYHRIGAAPIDRWHTLLLAGDALAALAKGKTHG